MNRSRQRAPERTVAVVFARLGPYHLARLRGAAEVLAREGVALAAIAIAGVDRIYAWDRVDTQMAESTHVLFPDASYETIPARQLQRRLEACLERINPLTVALPGWAFAEARAGLAWCRRARRPAILMSESSWNDHFRVWIREFVKGWMVRRFSSALVGGARHADYARLLGMPRAAIFTGYDAVDNDYFSLGAQRIREAAATERAARNLPARYVLTSSRFVPQKNLDGLLRGYALHAARAADARDLVICGDGLLRDSLQALAQSLGIASRVHWRGFVQYPELPAFYALADAFILASTTEPWGLVVNEAMASGLPVLVSTRCGCAPELVSYGVNGFTFEAHPPEAIAEALGRLPTDPDALAQMGRASQERIASFGVRAFGEGLLAAARLAVSRRGSDALALGGPGA